MSVLKNWNILINIQKFVVNVKMHQQVVFNIIILNITNVIIIVLLVKISQLFV